MYVLALALALTSQAPQGIAEGRSSAAVDDAVLAATRAGLRVEQASEQRGAVVLVVNALKDLVAEENARETLVGALEEGSGSANRRGVLVVVRDVDGSTRPLGHARADAAASAQSAPAVRHVPNRREPGEKPRRTSRLPFGGALVGLRVALSAGHGWLDDGAGGWATQRANFQFSGCGTCRGITEDFYSQEIVEKEIAPLLQNMGAEIIFVREPDHGIDDAVVVDDGDGGYAETLGTWSAGSTTGVGYNDDYRVNADTDPGSVAFTIAPSSRPRRISLRFPEGANRTASAVVSVVHEGGVRTFDVDQTKFGRFWLDLGAFPFGSGGTVEIAHGPATGFLIADVIKAGGGIDPDSRKPWWQMGARSYVPFAGSTDFIASSNDVVIRPRYAEFVGPDVYVSIHANATGAGPGSTAHGTSTYRYSCGQYGDHSPSDDATQCDDPPGSRELDDTVHNSIMDNVRGAWDPGWHDTGRLVADFGELRDLDTTPGILVETAFFDNLQNPGGVVVSDNQALQDPRWREVFARGLVRGVARFLAPGSDVPPERPDGVVAVNTSDGAHATLDVSWNAVAGASGYRVSLARLDSNGGRAFDEGHIADGNHIAFDASVLEAGRGYAVRVSALSQNGEGYASQAVVARFIGSTSTGASSRAPVLVVWGYDRRDSFVEDQDNPLDNAIEHGRALLDAGAFFDGALDEAVDAGAVSLSDYRLVDVATGKDSTEKNASGGPISSAMQAALAAFLDGGGAVIASGEEIGFAMVEQGDGTGAQFLADRFGAVYAEDDANTHDLVVNASGVFANVSAPVLSSGIDDNGGVSNVYDVVFPDGWSVSPSAGAGASAPFTYPDGTAAAIVTERTALFGAGLEAIGPDDARAAIFSALISHFGVDVSAGEGEGEGAQSGEGEGAQGGEGEGAQSGEGEGEGGAFQIATVPPGGGCGCTTSSPSATAPFALACALLSLATQRRRRRG